MTKDLLFIIGFVLSVMCALMAPILISKKNLPKAMAAISFVQVLCLCFMHDNHYENMDMAKLWFIGISIGIMVPIISGLKAKLFTIGIIIGFISLVGYSATVGII